MTEAANLDSAYARAPDEVARSLGSDGFSCLLNCAGAACRRLACAGSANCTLEHGAIAVVLTWHVCCLGSGNHMILASEHGFLPSGAGAQLDNYRLGCRLGSGGMSWVYEAEHRELGHVALKLLRSELCECDELVTRFLDEAACLRALSGEHVVRLLDAGCLENGVPFLALERLAGRDLAVVIKACRRLAAPVAVDYALAACDALAEAHSLGLIHCDVKPANLFLAASSGGQAQIKVLDFGIAEWVARPGLRGAAGEPRSLMGSPSYCSPEQLAQCERLDARTDIWSLGLVLFEMLSGVSPFAQTPMAGICARLRQPAPRLRSVCPDIVSGLAAVVERCLQKDRDRRFASMEEVAHALRPFASARRPARAHRQSSVRIGAVAPPRVTKACSGWPHEPYGGASASRAAS